MFYGPRNCMGRPRKIIRNLFGGYQYFDTKKVIPLLVCSAGSSIIALVDKPDAHSSFCVAMMHAIIAFR